MGGLRFLKMNSRERVNSSQMLVRCVKQHSSKCRQLHLSLVTPGPYIANRHPANAADRLQGEITLIPKETAKIGQMDPTTKCLFLSFESDETLR